MDFHIKNFSLKKFYKNKIFWRIRNFLLRIKIRVDYFNKIKNENSKIKISILREFFAPPYGGGNQFMLYLLKSLRKKGYKVKINSFKKDINLFIADYCWFPRRYEKLLENHKKKYNSKLIHRLDGILSQYRNDGKNMDEFAISINKMANATIIQSNYTANQFSEKGFDIKNIKIINNSPDEMIFNKTHNKIFDKKNIKIISASWSTNKKKGMDDYKWLDDNLKLKVNYSFIGRLDFIPKSIKLIEPLNQKALANKLKDSDIFLFAAINESCPNILIEAIACGLPIIYKNSGGSKELVKEFGLPYNEVSEIPKLLSKLIENYDYYKNLVINYSQPDASHLYENIIKRIIFKKS